MIRMTTLGCRLCALSVHGPQRTLRRSGRRSTPPPAAQGGESGEVERQRSDAATAADKTAGVPWTVGLYVSKRRDHRTNSLGEILEDDVDTGHGESGVMEPPKEMWNAER